jgi:hypothetical protein
MQLGHSGVDPPHCVSEARERPHEKNKNDKTQPAHRGKAQSSSTAEAIQPSFNRSIHVAVCGGGGGGGQRSLLQYAGAVPRAAVSLAHSRLGRASEHTAGSHSHRSTRSRHRSTAAQSARTSSGRSGCSCTAAPVYPPALAVGSAPDCPWPSRHTLRPLRHRTSPAEAPRCRPASRGPS